MSERLLLVGLLIFAFPGCSPSDASGAASEEASGAAPAVQAETAMEAGRYLVTVGGCHDCHTPGFMEDPEVPESQWLIGSPVGFLGPWGTSYPRNLRLAVRTYDEDQWVARLQGTGLPPMPWPSVNALSEADARAIYRYIRSLPEVDTPVPTPVPPGEDPPSAYFDFTVQHAERLTPPSP